MKKTIIKRPTAENCHLPNIHPLLQRLYSARAITQEADLDRELKGLLPFTTLTDIDKAAARLAKAIDEQQRVLIIGDYDCDGATSTALAVTALKAMGAKQVDYLIPNRFTYGYGLSPQIVDVAKARNPNVIITVDNGIASVAGVERANQLGIDVVITDHHLPGEQLPEAHAMVNPNQSGDLFPSKCIAGVGVIFYLMLALRARLKQQHHFNDSDRPCPNMAQFLDLVALGTVADVVSLDKNNRILVHQGLKRIQAGLARSGILALFEVAGRNPERVTSQDLGFIIGPRLNAAGRLDDMSEGVACLLAENTAIARKHAEVLDSLNRERRAIETQMREEAFSIVDQLDLNQQLPFGLCLYQPHWHEGVVGLVASKVKDKLSRPVIAFAKSESGALKGSARSISGLHIRDILNNIATKEPTLISKFGGHAMAAGLTIAADDYPAFSQAFADEVAQHITEQDLCGQIISDGELPANDMTLQIAELLENSGPWGQGFPKPLFDGEFNLLDQRIVGERHLKLLVQAKNSDRPISAIAFNVDVKHWPNYRIHLARLAYHLEINEYRGRRQLQLLVEDILL